MKRSEINKVVRKTLNSFPGLQFDDAVVKMLTKKVMAASSNYPQNYAYTVARNWAMDQYRHKEAEKRKRRREARRQAALRKVERQLTAAKEQFMRIAEGLLDEFSVGGRNTEKLLEAVWRRDLLGQSGKELQKAFSPMKRDAVYQVLCRGRRLVLERLSDSDEELFMIVSMKLRDKKRGR